MRDTGKSLLESPHGAAFALLLALWSMQALADFEVFVVRDMRVEGLQRISEGTVFNYLPINIGDRVDQIRVQESIRALYGQGLFDDIEIRRDGDTLIVGADVPIADVVTPDDEDIRLLLSQRGSRHDHHQE